MKKETARREIEALDYYLQNHTNDYSEESHMAMMMAIEALEQEPCEDCISRKEVLNQIFYSTDNSGDVVLGSELRGRIEKLPSVIPQEPRKVLSIDDVMSVFDDFMCGDVDEDGMNTFLEMLKDKAEV